jgi:hypothetical protein
MNLKNMALSDGSQMQRATECMIPSVEMSTTAKPIDSREMVARG